MLREIVKSLTALLLTLFAVMSAFCAEPKIDKPDLDVIFISRTPRYPTLQGKVTYIDLNKAKLINPEKDGNIKNSSQPPARR